MVLTYFISDTHFYHSNIIKYCNRPFESVYEMNETIIKNWNNVVKEDDTVYFVGDLTFRREIGEIFDLVLNLNGEKHLIRGNHDKWLKDPNILSLFASVQDTKTLSVDGVRVFLSHRLYPAIFPKIPKHAKYFLYGHTHGIHPLTIEDDSHLNVSADVLFFKPRTLQQIIDINRLHKKQIKLSEGYNNWEN